MLHLATNESCSSCESFTSRLATPQYVHSAGCEWGAGRCTVAPLLIQFHYFFRPSRFEYVLRSVQTACQHSERHIIRQQKIYETKERLVTSFHWIHSFVILSTVFPSGFARTTFGGWTALCIKVCKHVLLNKQEIIKQTLSEQCLVYTSIG